MWIALGSPRGLLLHVTCDTTNAVARMANTSEGHGYAVLLGRSPKTGLLCSIFPGSSGAQADKPM